MILSVDGIRAKRPTETQVARYKEQKPTEKRLQNARAPFACSGQDGGRYGTIVLAALGWFAVDVAVGCWRGNAFAGQRDKSGC